MATNCCARNYFRDQTYFYPNPDSDPPEECPTLVDGTGIINIQSAFAGVAGFYLQTDASNAVELDAGGSVIQTIPVAANHYVTAFPMDNPTFYAFGGPFGPYIFQAGSWQAMFDGTILSLVQNGGNWEVTAIVNSPSGVDMSNVVLQTSTDNVAWTTKSSPLTQNQRDGVDVITYAEGSSEHYVRFLITYSDLDCEFVSAVFTFLVP